MTTFLYSVYSITTHQNMIKLTNEGFTEITKPLLKLFEKDTKAISANEAVLSPLSNENDVYSILEYSI